MLIVLVTFAGCVALESNAFEIRTQPLRIEGDLALGVGVEYTDNVDKSQTNPEPETSLILNIVPRITAGLSLPIRVSNASLSLSTSASLKLEYHWETDEWEPDLGAPVVAALSLPLQVGGWLVTLSDSFTLNNEPLENTVVSESENDFKYMNMASLSVARSFGRLGFQTALVRTDKWSPDEPDMEETLHQISFIPSLALSEYHSAYWSHTVGWVQPADPDRSENFSYITTVGVNGRLTQTLDGTIGVGYSWVHLDPINSPTTNAPAQEIDGINAVLALNYAHPLRPNTTHSVSFAYSPGITALLRDSNIQESYSAAYSLTHRLNRNAVLTPSIAWNFIQDVGNAGSGEATHIVRIGSGLTTPLFSRMHATLSYFFQTRDSNLVAETYDAHQFRANIAWRLPRRITPELRYEFEQRNAQAADGSYRVNTVTFIVNYNF